MPKKKKRVGSYIVLDVTSTVTRELPVLKNGTTSSYFDYAEEKLNRYTYAFHQLYNRADESEDKAFKKEIMEKYSMSDIEYRSCKSEASALRISEAALDEERHNNIEQLMFMYSDPDTESGQRFEIINNIVKLERQIGHNAVFGSIALMRNLTRAYNRIDKADKNIPKLREEVSDLEDELDEMLQKEDFSKREVRILKDKINSKKREINSLSLRKYKAQKRIPKIKNDIKDKRTMDAYLMGEANQKGNRFIDFDLDNSKITLKITGDEKYEVAVHIPKNYVPELKKVQELIDRKEISVSVHFSKDYIKLHYEQAVVNGYAIDDRERRKEVKKIKDEKYLPETEKEKIKEIYSNHYKKQRQAMLVGKINGRCIAIDLNPGEIGYSVLQKTDNEEGYRIIAAGRISWEKLMRKSGRSSSSAKTKHLNRKRENAVCLALKLLFKVAAHYQCAEFIMEDLEFDDTLNDKTTEANRKCQNLWHRQLTERIINRRCVNTGISLIKINACYSSFIGNIQHDFCDPTNASVEIGRRGLLRNTKGKFYPSMTSRDLDTMSSIMKDGDKFTVKDVRDAQDSTEEAMSEKTWAATYKSIKAYYSKKVDFEYRYRTSVDETKQSFITVNDRYYNSRINYI